MPRNMKAVPFVLILAFFGLMAGPASGQAPLKIMISNDDGIDAPGIDALFDALSRIGTVTVAAPSQNRSGVGHGMNFDIPIMVRESTKKGARWIAIDALPATCVRLGIEALLEEKPDLVVSGINRGENAGTVTFYSATVACAREAAFLGIPAIAISLESAPEMDYSAAAEFVARLAREVMAKKLIRKGEYLNVNYPSRSASAIQGVLITKQDLGASLEAYEKRVNPAGRVYFWPYYKGLGPGAEKTDVWALQNGYISITPMSYDQTAESRLAGLDQKMLK